MTVEDIEASKAPLMDHLIELRSRLIKALLAFGIAFIFCFFFAKQIYNVLVWPFVLVAGAENSTSGAITSSAASTASGANRKACDWCRVIARSRQSTPRNASRRG